MHINKSVNASVITCLCLIKEILKPSVMDIMKHDSAYQRPPLKQSRNWRFISERDKMIRWICSWPCQTSVSVPLVSKWFSPSLFIHNQQAARLCLPVEVFNKTHTHAYKDTCMRQTERHGNHQQAWHLVHCSAVAASTTTSSPLHQHTVKCDGKHCCIHVVGGKW